MKKFLFRLLTAILALSLSAAFACADNGAKTDPTVEPSTQNEAYYTVTFVTDGNATVTVYKTQDMSADGEITQDAVSRDGDTGEPTDGDGQINFTLGFAEGYELDEIVINGSYNKLKGSGDTGYINGYRITRIASDLTVNITTKPVGAEDDYTEAIKATFVLGENVSVLVYKTQDVTAGGEETDVAYARDSATGALDNSGEGQINFMLVFAEGYQAESVTVTPAGNFKNLKLPAETGAENLYRITKVTGDITVTVTAKEKTEEEQTLDTVTQSAEYLSEYNGAEYKLTVDLAAGNSYTASENGGVLSVVSESALELTLSGTYAGGIEITVPSSSALKINLSGATLYATEDCPALSILSADGADVSAKNGTENYIYDKRSAKEDYKGALYCACDLNLKGNGELTVISDNNNGIHAKDDLTVKNLTLTVQCEDNAIKGNDGVTVLSGNITLTARSGDGIKTSGSEIKYNADGSVKKIQGTITVSGGTVTVYSASDAIDAAYNAVISGSPTVELYTSTTYAGSRVNAVQSSAGDYYYIKYGATTYNYSLYFYNSQTGDGVWENPDSYDKVTSSDAGGGFRPGPNGQGGQSSSAAYYYRVEKPQGDYDKVIVYAYTQAQTQGQSETCYAKTDSLTINTARNTITVSSVSSGKLTTGWATFTGDTTVSAKGIKADNEILISGGTVTIKSSDDGIHANNDVVLGDEDDLTDDYYGNGVIRITGGTVKITTLDDGVHADTDVYFSEADGALVLDILTSYEGIEGNRIYVSGGKITAYATDDAMNAALCTGGNTPLISISGGVVDLTTPRGDTDTMDSNGNVTVSGGVLILKNGQQSATSMTGGTMDLDGSLSVTGGIIISVGCWCNEASLTCNVTDTSSTLSAGDYSLKNGSGTSVAEFSLDGSYKGYRICVYGKSGTYTLYKGSSAIKTF